MKLYSLYKMGSKEPEYTGITNEEKKRKKTHADNTLDRERKVATPQTAGQLADEKLIATQAQQSQGEARRTCGRDNPA